MKFKDVELLPGVVIDAKDPKMLGRVKATVPTLFDSSAMDVKGMPWIYPISMIGYQGFSKLQKGSKIWVYKTEGNYREFWYMPMFEANASTREIIADYEEPDVLISRSAGSNSVFVYYTDKQGIMMKVGENSFINLKANGEILAKASNGTVSIRDNKVYIGSENAKQPTVLGNDLDKVLAKLAADLQSVAGAANMSPYTMSLFQPLATASQNLSQGIGDKIKTKDVIVS